MVEPGRSIVGEAGVLVARVLFRKRNGNKEFVIVDAAMNDLIRPALYHSHHEIVPVVLDSTEMVRRRRGGPGLRNRRLPGPRSRNAGPAHRRSGAICTAGAYGFVQASNYNSRPRPAEVLVEGSSWRIIRRRESYEDLIQPEL